MMIDSKLQMLSMLKAIKKQDESALLGMLEIKCFLLAYERYARKYGVNSSCAITRTELTAGVDLLDEFVREWPMIAKRFGDGKGVELPLKDL